MYHLVPIARLMEFAGRDIDVRVGAKRIVVAITHRPAPAEATVFLVVDVEVVLDRRGHLAGFDPERPRFCVRAGGRLVAESGDVPAAMGYYAEEARLLVEAIKERAMRGSRSSRSSPSIILDTLGPTLSTRSDEVECRPDRGNP